MRTGLRLEAVRRQVNRLSGVLPPAEPGVRSNAAGNGAGQGRDDRPRFHLGAKRLGNTQSFDPIKQRAAETTSLF